MLISEISSLISWAGDTRNTVVRETIKYDRGNDVTVVRVLSEKFEQTYDEKGKETSLNDKGTNVDIRA
jgi:hypothetical protein